MKLALDATYSVGSNLSGVGVYSRELLHALAAQHPEVDWRWLYRSHRWTRALRESPPPHVRRGLLLDRAWRRNAALFHGLNQRLPLRAFPLEVVTFHDLFVLTADYSTPEFRARFAAQARHAAARAHRIIAVSRFTAREVVRLLGVNPNIVTAVPHGIRPLPPPTPGIEREPLILHVGAIQKRKNLVRLVQAFDDLPGDWRLVLAGSYGFDAASVLGAVDAARNRARVTVTGYIGLQELADWYARASVFAFPSLDEGFGMPVLEAMAAGVPTLVANSSALPEVAGDAALLVNPLSVEEISAGLHQLVSDRSLRMELAAQGRVQAARFTWARAAEETWRVYSELLNRSA